MRGFQGRFCAVRDCEISQGCIFEIGEKEVFAAADETPSRRLPDVYTAVVDGCGYVDVGKTHHLTHRAGLNRYYSLDKVCNSR